VLELPATDYALSPYTGWTRTHWLTVADTLLRGVRPFASPGHALINLPGPASRSGRWSDGLEGFARTFLLAAFRLAGSSRREEPAMTELADWYALGVAAGTDPKSPERWPTLLEKGQAKVECASVALALHLTRDWIWNRLDDQVRQHVVAWMADMIGTSTPNNNWIWFVNLTQAFLKSVGGPWRPDDIERNLAKTESWYVGDGWYSDGDVERGAKRNFDYYNGWAMHFYPLWYSRIIGADALLDTYQHRLSRFLTDAQHLVGADGAPLFQGRSLTYRFAMLAPFWTGAVFGATPLAPGLTRRLASGVLSHFVRAGVPDERALLPLGWYHAFPSIRQDYSGPGSPYWVSKGFAGIALSADHPVWTEQEQPMAIETADVAVALRGPGWLVSGTTADGVVRMVNHGGDHARPGLPDADDPFYDRFSYSTLCAPDLGRSDHVTPIDSHVALIDEDGRASLRRPYERVDLDGRTAVSWHRTHWDPQSQTRFGPVLTVASVLRGQVEVRIVRVDDPPDRPLWLRVGGAALADDRPPATMAAGAWAEVRRADDMTSAVTGLLGDVEAGVTERKDANPFGRYSTCPLVRGTAPVTSGAVYAVAIQLGRGGTTDGVNVTLTEDDVVTVSWPDGERDEVWLEAPPRSA
jgi:hypothetical protein